MTKKRFNLRNVVKTVACLAVLTMFSGCGEQIQLPEVDEAGLTAEIRKIIPDEYLEKMKESGFIVHGGNTPPNIEGTYFVNPLHLVANRTSKNVSEQWDKYVSFYEQNNKKLTIKAEYTMKSGAGYDLTAKFLRAFIIGESNKFTVFADGTRDVEGYTAKTVEVFSGEIIEGGIKNYQWGMLMVDDNGDPTDTWIENGEFYLKKDGDGFSERVNKEDTPLSGTRSAAESVQEGNFSM